MLYEAEDLAARTLAAIEYWARSGHWGAGSPDIGHLAADRERVASDLDGLRRHRPILVSFGDEQDMECAGCGHSDPVGDPCADARTFSDNLRRTAALYPQQSSQPRP